MVIEVISSNTIKVILDENDMSSYDVSFEKLDRSSPETKRLLIDLIERIREEKSIDLSSERLFVEAFPKEDGGCLLYLSMLNSNVKVIPEKSNLYNTVICRTDSPKDLMTIASKLYHLYSHILHNSELYYLEGVYILILHTFKRADKKLRSFLSEFCELTGSGDVDSSAIREHFSCVFPINAIEEINKKQIAMP